MADGDSVGKISLDMEIGGDLSNQISKAAEQIGERIEASLKNMGDLDFKGIADTIGNTIEKSINSSMKSIQNSIESTINKALANVKGIKIPVDFEVPSNISMPYENTETKIPQPRAPPIPKVTSQSTPKVNMPKIDAGVNLEAVKAQIDNLTRSLDITNAKIEQQMEKLADLKASYNQAFDGARKNKLQEQILKTEESINKLTAQSDKAGFKLADLDAQFDTLENASKKATAGVDSVDNALKRMSNQSTQANKEMKNMSNSTKDMGNSMNRSYGGMKMFIDSMFKWGIVFPMIIGGLGTMASFMGSAFMTNTQFANSLNQIKSNLMTAFMPIYQAVLPALNSLMSALATVTAYIASFTSQLFGKTYSASFGAAQAMQQSIGAYSQAEKQAKKTADSLGGVSKSAKSAGDAAKKAGDEAKKGLAGFDEINKLSDSSSTATPKTTTPAGDGVTTPITPMANMAPIEAATQGWVDKFKNLMASLWKPFQEAWAAEGQNTINAAKHALQGIEDLLGAIGKSFYTVWTNGTGERILVNLLKILQDILNIIGDIGITFANAWNKGNIGTQIVQSLANAFNNVLSLIDKMLQSIRHVWAEEGPTFANIFMQALKATTGVIENVTEKLGWIWDHGGQHAFEGLVKLGLKVGELALFIYTNFVVPFVNWFVNMIAPAISIGLDWIGKLTDKLSELVDYLQGNGAEYTRDFLILFTGFKVAGFIANIVNSTLSIIANTTAKVANTLATSANNTANEAGILAKAKDIGANIQLIGLYVGETAAKIASTAATIGRTVATTAGTIAQVAHNIAVTAWTAICGIATIATTAFGAAIAFLTSPIGLAVLAIAGIIAIGILLYKNWDTIKAKATEVWSGVTATFNTFKDWLGNVFSTDWSSKFGWMGDILNGFLANVRNIFNGVREIFGGLIDFIQGVFTGNWGQAWRGVVEIFRGIFGTIGGIVKAPLNLAISAINTMISGLNHINISVPDWLGGGDFGFSLPKIPYLAKGGIVDSPTLSMIGEAGKEAVVPLENNTGGLDLLAQKLSQKISSTGAIQQPQLTMVGNNIGNSAQNSNTGSIDDFRKAIIEAMVEAIKELKDNGNDKSNSGSSSGDLIFKVGDTELGKIAIAAINKVQRQAGVTLLKV